MTKVELHESQRILEINGQEYPVAKRSGMLEKRLIEEHDEKLTELTEYERYKVLISLLLGEESFDALFPDREAESLDALAQVAYFAQREFNANAKELEKQKTQDETENILGDMDTINAKIAALNKNMDGVISKAELSKGLKYRKKK